MSEKAPAEVIGDEMTVSLVLCVAAANRAAKAAGIDPAESLLAIGYNQLERRCISRSPLELAAGGEEFPCVGTNLASADRASF